MSAPLFSIITPVHNGGEAFERCLAALALSEFHSYELIVVDDGSSDDSLAVARGAGARVLETGGRRGPAAARNLGASEAVGEFLLFLDADCEVTPATLAEAARVLEDDPGLAGLFGSYDDSPAARSLVSQYKNLQHHWVHQQGREIASTFWAGCGAIRRSVFEQVGGFDASLFGRPSIEDIELGGRLRSGGHRIRLAKNVQVKHHKRWGLWSLIRTDVIDRGIPWTRLMLTNRQLSLDLNLDVASRLSGVAAWLLVASVFGAGLWSWRLLWVTGALAAALLWLNRGFYQFLRRRRGWWFLLRAVPLHWLYYLYSVAAFGLGAARHIGSARRFRGG